MLHRSGLWMRLLAVFLSALVLAGCYGSGLRQLHPDEGGAAPSIIEDVPPAGSALPAITAQSILLLTSPTPIDGDPFLEDLYNGVLAFMKSDLGSDITVAQGAGPGAPSPSEAMPGHDVAILVGRQYAGSAVQLAAAHSDRRFILVDALPEDAQPENLLSLAFREEECGFLAGVAAALETETGRVASVHGAPDSLEIACQLGFEAGVAYANRHLSTAARPFALGRYAGRTADGGQIGGNYIGSRNNQSAGKILGENLLRENVDLIYVACGASGEGILEAVVEGGGARVIGSSEELAGRAELQEHLITAVYRQNAGAFVERALRAIADGSFSGGSLLLGAELEAVGYLSEAGAHLLSETSQTELSIVLEKLRLGEIVPPNGANGYLPEDFPGL